ncbi:MAG: PAS domain S-box protein [Candidatus Marinimicrobia bacterium]|nr:PAS domain S-box protein [Candidatus Neomarinimicrobiota bacterium]MCF7850031.1 PAS domain S-box protein [Candidatus Neomarinimicrobiota bacterium]
MDDIKANSQILDLILQNSTASIMITDSEGSIEYVNPKFVELTGYSESELLGANARMLQSGRQSKDFYKDMWETITSGNVWHGLFQNKKKDGELYTESAQIIPVRDNKNQISHYLAIKEHLTTSGDMALELEAFAGIIGKIPIELYIVDIQDLIYLFNNSAAQQANQGGGIVGLHVREIRDESYEEKLKRSIKTLFSGSRDRLWERHNYKNAAGEKYPVQEIIIPVSYQQKDAVLICATDISKLVRIEDELKTQKQELEQYFDLASEIILLLDGTGKVRKINTSGSKLLGYPTSDLIGKDWITTCIPGYKQNAVRQSLKDVMESGEDEPIITESPVLTKSGDLRIIEWRSSAHKNTNEELVTILSTGTDITERKVTEEQKTLIAELVEQSDDIITLISLDFKYESTNTAYNKAFNREGENLAGKSLREVLGIETFDSIEQKLISCREGNVVNFSEWVTLPQKGRRLLRVKYTPMLDNKGKVRGIIAVSRDETERALLEEKQAELTNQLHQSQRLEAIGRLAGGIGHEFNNILQVQSLNLGLMKGYLSEDDELYENYLQIEKVRERASQLVRQILTFSRHNKPQIQRVRSQAIISEVLKLISATAPKAIKIEQSINKEVKMIQCDPTYIDQIVLCLCENAVQAMEDIEGRDKILRIHYDYADAKALELFEVPAGNDYLELKICDTGQGMDEETAKHMYDPFFTKRSSGQGTGLGLSVAYGMITDMGGAIRVDTELDRGTCFHVLFPITEGEEKEEDGQTEMEDLVDRTDLNILFIDDEEIIRSAAEKILVRKGHKIQAYETAEEALDILLKDHTVFDLIICDLALPGMSGLEFIEVVRKKEIDTHIIISSGNIELDVEESIDKLPNTSYLRKPWDKDQLLIKVNLAMSNQDDEPK